MLVHKVLPLMRKIQLPISDYFSNSKIIIYYFVLIYSSEKCNWKICLAAKNIKTKRIYKPRTKDRQISFIAHLLVLRK